MIFLPLYLLLLAALFLHVNMKAGSRPGKMVSYWGMWAAIGASAYFAFTGYTW